MMFVAFLTTSRIILPVPSFFFSNLPLLFCVSRPGVLCILDISCAEMLKINVIGNRQCATVKRETLKPNSSKCQ